MKNTFKLLTGVIIIYILIKLGCLLIKTIWPGSFTTHLYYLVYLSSFDSMAFGGLAAFFLFKEKKFVTEFLFSKLVQWIVFPVLAISLIIGINLPFFNFEFFSIMFAFLIVNLAANKKVIFSLENKLWHYLGKISFGLYMYHFIAITLTRKFVNHFPFISHWVQFSLMLGLTVLMAACSYHFYEKFFIRRKIRYANIITGDNIAGRASGFFMHMPDKKNL